MYGAIIGDLAGSIYEYEQVKSIKRINMNKIIPDNAFYSDDTILTIAILNAILDNKDYTYYLKKYINDYKDYKPNFKPYFNTSFSPNMIKWSNENIIGNSKGNGAMMRISPVGFMFDDEKSIINQAKQATIPSHNSIDAIDNATLIALIIYYLRKGLTKEEIIIKLNLDIKYIPFAKFNTLCNTTIDNCLYAFFISDSFHDAIKKTLSMGGDTDTNCAIVGSMAEALYGIDDHLINKTNEILPSNFVELLNEGYKRILRK